MSPADPVDLPVPQPLRDCPHCDGGGVVVSRSGELAVARVCSCLAPCQRCGGTGRVAVRTDGVVTIGRCRCQSRSDRVALFNRAGLPARHADSTIESFARGARAAGDHDKTPALGGVSTWLAPFAPDTENRGLILHGPVGRGKTHLLVGIVRHLVLELGVQARFLEFTRLLGLLREGYDQGRGDRDLFNELATVPVLAIDELGKGRVSDWERTVIDEIVSRRYNSLSCTLGTTNYAPESASGNPLENLADPRRAAPTLGDRVGDRVYSRLLEMCDFVAVGGRDFRQPDARRGS